MQTGDVIASRYTITGEIAKGGWGRVWQARDLRLDRVVAIKFQHPADDGSEETYAERLKRFTQEAGINAQLSHQCVPAIYDSGSHDGRFYIVMEYVQGMTLRDFINENRPIPIPVAVAITVQICAALGVTHSLGVVHRDLKPLNIMITDHGLVKLLDFGVAAVLDPTDTRMTTAGRQIGTEAYMSPEQIQGLSVDTRADIYALGCLLYELLVGERIFPEVTGYHLQTKHINADPEPPQHRRPEIATPLDLLVLAMLSKDPETRPTDVNQVYDQLAMYLPGPASRDPISPPIPDPTAPFRRPFAPAPSDQSAQPARSPTARRQAIWPTREEARRSHRDARELIGHGKHRQAADKLKEILGRLSPALGARDTLVLDLRADYADALLADHQHETALAEYQRLVVDNSSVFGRASTAVQRAAEGATDCRIALGDLTTALIDVQTTLADREDKVGVRNPDLFSLRLRECQLLALLTEEEDGAHALQLLLHDAKAQFGPDSTQVAEVEGLVRNMATDGPAGRAVL